jgi:hypothetical protein
MVFLLCIVLSLTQVRFQDLVRQHGKVVLLLALSFDRMFKVKQLDLLELLQP